MTIKTAYIVSLKFSPGLKKEFIALGENIRKKGINVKYLLSIWYKELEGNCDGIEYLTTSRNLKEVIMDSGRLIDYKKLLYIFSRYPPIFLCFYNPHPFNPFVARFVKKKFNKVITALYLHDPYKPDKTPYGTAKATYIKLVEFIQDLTVKYMDHIISPSGYSSQLFKKRYPKFKGETHIAPLLIPDQKALHNKKRRFFSIVGGVNPATGLDTFVELVNHIALKKLNYEFALISSSNISGYLRKLTSKARTILKIINKKLINDSEINEVIRKSYAGFRLDKEVTQSGIIPVSFMNETPVIVRNIPGLRQHVKHKYNGYILPLNCTFEELIKSMDFVKQNFSWLSHNARRSYEDSSYLV
ncbi:MAG: hypothetical protein B5M53_07305 [Candidatus Cloacimonas sp. 4484_209]|nr:MAG: hypothetical protein B5M53_07305 [Candidatus Cloacimonas sp. 4484_209]